MNREREEGMKLNLFTFCSVFIQISTTLINTINQYYNTHTKVVRFEIRSERRKKQERKSEECQEEWR